MEKKPDKLVPAVIGGVIMGVLSSVPILNFINCFCCAGIILGGFFAVYFYNKNLGEQELIYSDGAMLGILAGVFGLIVSSILNVAIGNSVEKILEQVMQYADDIPPEALDVISALQENSGKLFFVNIAMGLVIDILFGLLGGILGVAILGKKKANG